MNDYSLTDILDEASMPSLFSSTKVIIGNNFNNYNDLDIEYLTKYISNKNIQSPIGKTKIIEIASNTYCPQDVTIIVVVNDESR